MCYEKGRIIMDHTVDNITGITVIRDGNTVFEQYADGVTREDKWNVMSVTKSVCALLCLIAMDRGFIESADARVMDFFPEAVLNRGEKTAYDVRLDHLLTMTAPYKFRSEPWTRICTSDDWTLSALRFLGGKKGISGDFRYTTLGIQILTGIIERASGMSCIDLANKYLFEPLSIEPRRLHGGSDKDDQRDYTLNKLPHPAEWYNDPVGSVTAGWGLCLSSEEMAKIGQLVLDRGLYNGKRVISEERIDEMTSPHIKKTGEMFGNMAYGYLWWLPRGDRPVFAAVGDGGNVIYADGEKNVTVGVTATFKPRIFDRLEYIEKVIIPKAVT